jgi:tRNA dimethylallyltransferase
LIKAIAIVGPTASGKTELSLTLAEKFSGEIISCDSMQIYKGMDIGTAKATEEEQKRVKHHMLDLVSPLSDYSVDAYKKSAVACAEELSARGKLPVFVGGTGLYLDSLLRGDDDAVPPSDKAYRDALIASVSGDADALWERLCAVDGESAAAIHKNNVKRVVRALEIYDKTGIPKSVFDKRSREVSAPVDMGIILLSYHERETLYKRIDRRVDIMCECGLIEEVRALYGAGLLREGTTAYQAIGYKELIGYIKGERSLSECIDEIKLSTRRYAKRQLTWFKHEREAYTLYMDDESGALRDGCDIIAEAVEFTNGFLSKE